MLIPHTLYLFGFKKIITNDIQLYTNYEKTNTKKSVLNNGYPESIFCGSAKPYIS